MICTYSDKAFVDRFKNGTLKHVFREDILEYWEVGHQIHHWFSLKGSEGFNDPPFQFGKNELISKEPVLIMLDYEREHKIGVVVKGKSLSDDVIGGMILTSGYSSAANFREQFFERNGSFSKTSQTPWSGFIIHWTNLTYCK